MNNNQIPFNGNYYDEKGIVKNLDGQTISGNGVQKGMLPFNGNFLDSTGNIKNIGELGGGTTASKKYSTFIIGTSTEGHTLEEVDYLCDGVNDHIEIQEAINALSSRGGKILLREGVYNLAGAINLNKPNTTLEGMGIAATDIVCSVVNAILFSSPYTSFKKISATSSQPYFLDVRASNVTIDECSLIATYYTINIPSSANASDITIKNSTLKTSTNLGEHYGLVGSGTRIVIQNCMSISAGFMLAGCYCMQILGCQFRSVESPYAIYLDGTNQDCIISGCIFKGSEKSSIYVGSNAKRTTVVGNSIIRAAGIASDYDATRFSIALYGSNSLVANNLIMGKDVTNSGSGNTVVNNKYQ